MNFRAQTQALTLRRFGLGMLLFMAACTRQLTPNESLALLGVTDVLSMHDADRLLGRLEIISQRLPEALQDDSDAPGILRFSIIPPEPVTNDMLQEMGYIGPALPSLVLIAARDAADDALGDQLQPPPEDGEPVDEPALTEADTPPSSRNTPDEAAPIRDAAESESTGDGAEDTQYLALLPLPHSSNAVWPVVIISNGEVDLRAANLRDYLATELLKYQPPEDGTLEWTELIQSLWLELRLGIADPEAIAQRTARAKTALTAILEP